MTLCYLVSQNSCSVPEHTYVKVGHTKNMRRRLMPYETHSPHRTMILAACPGGKEVERSLTKKLRKHRAKTTSREWFSVPNPVLEQILLEPTLSWTKPEDLPLMLPEPTPVPVPVQRSKTVPPSPFEVLKVFANQLGIKVGENFEIRRGEFVFAPISHYPVFVSVFGPKGRLRLRRQTDGSDNRLLLTNLFARVMKITCHTPVLSSSTTKLGRAGSGGRLHRFTWCANCLVVCSFLN